MLHIVFKNLFIFMNFILQREKFNIKDKNNLSAPIFIKEFFLSETEKKGYFINICCPNIAVCKINGKLITKDIFISATSVWDKTLYVHNYKVDRFLKSGKNVITVMLGNGLKNENVSSVWNLDKESFRGFPKFALELYNSDGVILQTDESWQYTLNSKVIYNQFRVGEYVDFTVKPDYANLSYAILDKGFNGFKLIKCNFPTVRECETLSPKSIFKVGQEKTVIDFGKNISGYVKLSAVIPFGKQVKLIYAERLNQDFSPDFGEMPKHFKDIEFQTDKIVGNGKKISFKPHFTYHGFRYVIVDGINEIFSKNIKAVFIHQNIKQALFFDCSDKTLKQLFDMSVNALLSNSVNLFTDCPTREKFGWLNDAMCSAESLLYLFDCKKFALKLLKDFVDSVSSDGLTVSLIPVCEWSKNNCHGIFTACAIFEFADKIFDIYGDLNGYKISYDALKLALNRFLSEKQDNGLFTQHYGLGDWAGPYDDYLHPPAPLQFTDSVLMYKCLCIMAKSARLLKKQSDFEFFTCEANALRVNIIREYLNPDGSSKINEMSVLSLLIAFDLHDNISPLKSQLKNQVIKHDFHHYCGMISLRYLFVALDKCNLQDYAYKIITAKGYPSFSKWIDDGDTSLCETWSNGASHNHHMYSFFVNWIIQTLCGFQISKGKVIKSLPLNCVDEFSLCYVKSGKVLKIIKNKKKVDYENS